jgi:hypothetical protein
MQQIIKCLHFRTNLVQNKKNTMVYILFFLYLQDIIN